MSLLRLYERLENSVLRKLFWKSEVTGEWKKLHNEKLDNLCCYVIKWRPMSCANIYKIAARLKETHNILMLLRQTRCYVKRRSGMPRVETDRQLKTGSSASGYRRIIPKYLWKPDTTGYSILAGSTRNDHGRATVVKEWFAIDDQFVPPQSV